MLIPIFSPDREPDRRLDRRQAGGVHTATYFEMYFTEQYQKESMETDVVMDIRFPQRIAAGTAEYQGQTHHFYTNESLHEFEQNPSLYVGPQ